MDARSRLSAGQSPTGSPPLLLQVGPSRDAPHDAGELLGALDDAMFAAIAGDASALVAARLLWPAALATLSTELIVESREQYLHFALEQSLRSDLHEGHEGDEGALVAIGVLELLASA